MRLLLYERKKISLLFNLSILKAMLDTFPPLILSLGESCNFLQSFLGRTRNVLTYSQGTCTDFHISWTKRIKCTITPVSVDKSTSCSKIIAQTDVQGYFI